MPKDKFVLEKERNPKGKQAADPANFLQQHLPEAVFDAVVNGDYLNHSKQAKIVFELEEGNSSVGLESTTTVTVKQCDDHVAIQVDWKIGRDFVYATYKFQEGEFISKKANNSRGKHIPETPQDAIFSLPFLPQVKCSSVRNN